VPMLHMPLVNGEYSATHESAAAANLAFRSSEDAGTPRDWFEFERQNLMVDIWTAKGNGTEITVSKGCILVGNDPVCEVENGKPAFKIEDRGSKSQYAVFYGGFTGDTTKEKEAPGCKLAIEWDATIPQLNYDEQNCLYANGIRLTSGCCTEKTTDEVANPYFAKTTDQAAKPGFIFPSNLDGRVDCLDKTDGGGCDMSRVLWTSGSVLVMDNQRLAPDLQISTTDRSKCKSSGVSTNAEGLSLSEWCVVYQQDDAVSGLV
jgi:hypothetical protein